MISSVPNLGASLNDFSRALSGGLRSLADLQTGEETPLRGVAEVGSDTASTAGRGDQPTSSLFADPQTPDPAQAAVDILTTRAQVRAAIAVVRTNDDTLGTLIDTVG